MNVQTIFKKPHRKSDFLCFLEEIKAKIQAERQRSQAEVEASQKAHRERMEARHPDFV